MDNKILTGIIRHKLIAIVRGIESSKMLKLIDALQQGCISCIEVTFDQTSEQGINNTIESLELLKSNFDQQITLGAGTVMSVEQVEMAKNAGASFILSPNTDIDVIRKTKELGLISMPGAFTASEAVCAWNAGADVVKLFPISQLGASYIKALRGPLGHMRFSAVGGVNEHNAREFLQAGACCLGIGGNLVDKNLIAADNFNEIKRLAAVYVETVKTDKML